MLSTEIYSACEIIKYTLQVHNIERFIATGEMQCLSMHAMDCTARSMQYTSMAELMNITATKTMQYMSISYNLLA